MKKEFEKKQLVKKSENFSQWYIDVILKSGLADYAPVKGCQVIKPYGYGLWENIQRVLDEKFKEKGIKNAYFPLFIPEKFLKREKEHIKGFSPELAVVTIGGGEELKEKLVVRPTSETIIYEMYAKWIKSWRDLPLLINQWCNVVRWEMRPRLFLRTTEFLWQEAHTVHQTEEEALEMVKWALENYVNVYQDFFAIDGISGQKSESEKFPGAKTTQTFEILMPDGKALQGCTSHDLGQNFAQAFNLKFLDKDGKEKMPYQTCFGLSTRCLGALIMVHGDDQGLILPPKLAPIQIVIIPILPAQNLIQKAKELKNVLKEFRVEIDFTKEHSIGWKFNEWEIKGVPLRIELGQKELKEKKATLARRDTGQKISISLESLENEVKEILEAIQKNLLERSRKFLKENTKDVSDYRDFKEIMKKEKGFIKAFWCQNPKCEAKIKEETKATVRVLPFDAPEEKGKCIYCQETAEKKWIFGQAY
ncbi:proline--tRNA ligase [Patescibacteria group bacterium]|nr:proline--tRNA ligase [Patescibacteria group bacterium]MBU4481650.1 proline--tRNA ligase [Patescibacteria group bacterium]